MRNSISAHFLVLAACIAFLLTGMVAAQDAEEPQEPQELQSLGQDIPTLIQECESCHGPNGNSDQPDIPSLAGSSVEHIQASIDQFYFYERHCPTVTYRYGEHESAPPMNMCSIASGLSDAEVLALAGYFSQQERIVVED